jgi:hypothetical protein
MTSRDFCFWLQGFLELREDTPSVNTMQGLTGHQAEVVRKHLALVFKHEIDPAMGDKAKQAELSAIHQPGGGQQFRC